MDASSILKQQLDANRILELQKTVDDLRTLNESLKTRHAKSEKDTHEFVAYFQKELGRKEEVISDLTKKSAAAKVKWEIEIADIKKSAEEQVNSVQHQARETVADLKTNLNIVNEDIANLEKFREMKHVIEGKLESLESSYEADLQTETRKYEDLERRTLEEKSKFQKVMDLKIEKIKQQSVEEARNGLDADTRKIIRDNKRMADELRFQLNTTSELQSALKKSETLVSAQRLEISIQAEKEKEYAEKSAKQGKEITMLTEKVKHLERTLTTMVSDFEREKRMLHLKNERTLEDQSCDTDSLKRLLKIKTKELKTVKNLASTILDQRTDVEHFFLESLEHVRREILKTKQEEAHNNNIKHPHRVRRRRKPHGISGGGNRPEIMKSKIPEKVDIKELGWEDRERVLRLLFAKINSVQGFLGSSENDRRQKEDSVFITE